MFWHFPAYLQSYAVWTEQRDPLFRSRPCSIIRYGDWKLHQYFEDGGLELYNLRDDVGEAHNLAGSHPEKREELLKHLQTWQQKTNAPIPTKRNPKFDPQAEKQAIAKRATKSDR